MSNNDNWLTLGCALSAIMLALVGIVLPEQTSMSTYPYVNLTGVPQTFPYGNLSGVPQSFPYSNLTGVPNVFPYGNLTGIPQTFPYGNLTGIPQSFPYGNLTGVPNVDLMHGLVLWLPFDGVSSDKSGYANNGVSYGSPVYVNGKFERCLSFDGVNDYVDCGNSKVLDLPSNYSFTFWINGTLSLYSNGGIILARSEAVGNSFSVNVQARGTYFSVRLERVAVVIDADFALYANSWYFISMVFNGSYLNFYFNGVFSQSFSSSFLALVTVPFNIGRRAYSPYENYLNATLDDVRVYNRALSASEVLALYNLP